MSYFVFYCKLFCVSCSRLITSIGERDLICLLLLTCKYVVSVRRSFPLLWVRRIFYCGTPWAFHIIISQVEMDSLGIAKTRNDGVDCGTCIRWYITALP